MGFPKQCLVLSQFSECEYNVCFPYYRCSVCKSRLYVMHSTDVVWEENIILQVWCVRIDCMLNILQVGYVLVHCMLYILQVLYTRIRVSCVRVHHTILHILQVLYARVSAQDLGRLLSSAFLRTSLRKSCVYLWYLLLVTQRFIFNLIFGFFWTVF